MNVLITICARGGSKGVPGKNIKPLNGKPLIYYTIEVAKQFQQQYQNVSIILSSDSNEIIKVAEYYGLKSDYVRPAHLSDDKSGKVDAVNDILLWCEKENACTYDYVLDLDVTSPLRNLTDLTSAFEMIQNNKEAINLFSVSPANKNPYFNMVEQKENGFYSQIKALDNLVFSRQSAPKVYDLNASFYFYKREFFSKGNQSAITEKSMIYEVPHICFDIDHPIDFELISFLVEKDKLDFKL